MAGHRLAIEPDIDEIPRVIDWVERCCGDDGVDSGVTFKMMLAVEEALANVVAHAFVGVPPPHLIQLRLDIAADRCVAAEFAYRSTLRPPAPCARRKSLARRKASEDRDMSSEESKLTSVVAEYERLGHRLRFSASA